MVNQTVKPRWLATSKTRADFSARCISPCQGEWRPLAALSDESHKERLVRELTIAHVTKAFLLGPDLGSNKILHYRDPWDTNVIQQKITLCHHHHPVEGVWLRAKEHVVAEMSGKPFLMIKGGESWLAARFTPKIMNLVAEEFGARGVCASNITVHALFAAPRTPNLDYFEEVRHSSRQAGIHKVEPLLRLPLNGKFGYEKNPEVTAPNLGIFCCH